MNNVSDPTAPEQQHDPRAAREAFEKGSEAEKKLDRWGAIEHYERAFELSPDDDQISFRLAYNLDLVGEESEAVHLYEQACKGEAPRVQALVNLAVLYEDIGEYAKAERCLRLVVETDPNHARARLYLGDVVASRSMYYEEDYQRLRDRQSSVLDTPVTDFELSARARNCLQKMNVRTLGDLVRTSEADLMAYKNFGETTLEEIRGMLSQKGLHVGQGLQGQQQAARQEVHDQVRDTAGEETADNLNRPVDELELSVRAHKALDLLSISTIGDLVSRTEDELLGIKNFGETSLEEIKERLAEHGLSLRTLEE